MTRCVPQGPAASIVDATRWCWEERGFVRVSYWKTMSVAPQDPLDIWWAWDVPEWRKEVADFYVFRSTRDITTAWYLLVQIELFQVQEPKHETCVEGRTRNGIQNRSCFC